MTTENKFDTSAFIAGYMDTYGQEPSYAVVVDAAVEQLKAELEKVQQDKASNDSDYLKLSAENNTLKSKLKIATEALETASDYMDAQGQDATYLEVIISEINEW